MKLLQKLVKSFDGLQYPQEYLCVDLETFQQPLHVYAEKQGRIVKDIKDVHCFIGYSPLILSLFSKDNSDEQVEIVFTQKSYAINEIISPRDALARLQIQKLPEQPFIKANIVLYEGTHGEHKFVSGFHQYMIGLHNNLFQKKAGNVFLENNLYRQVQIAYGMPRNISLITVKQGELYNCFPTDLHGASGEDHYLISLRHQGKACRQVMQSRRILISQVRAETYKIVYGLGRNHMQDMKSPENFPFSGHLSSHFELPIPASTLRYRELELEDSFNHGIHKLMLFRVLGNHTLGEEAGTLAHIHNVYASWRHNNRLPGNYLLR